MNEYIKRAANHHEDSNGPVSKPVSKSKKKKKFSLRNTINKLPKMIHRTFLPSLLFASSALALPAKQTIKWGECEDKVPGVELQCAELPVPLDYTDPDSSATYPLRLMKAPVAKNTTSKGSLIFNFGGPGESSLEIFPAGVENLRK